VSGVFSRDWAPDGTPKAAIALVHGLGEHSGRYEELAARFTSEGYAVWAIDLRGHGESPGQRGDIRFAPALEDIDALVARAGASGAGMPVFLYGHSLGALLSVLWLLERPAAPVRGAVISAIGVHSALREQAFKVRLARTLGKLTPKLRVKAGIDTSTLSRDPEVVRAYEADKRVHNFASMGFGLDGLEAIDTILERAPQLTVPLLLVHGSEDQLAYASGARELAALAPGVTTLKVYDGLFHEIHHEPEKEQVHADVLAWLDRQLGNR
jgi:alpha-beta hydrolase superfamily lysophospholipase